MEVFFRRLIYPMHCSQILQRGEYLKARDQLGDLIVQGEPDEELPQDGSRETAEYGNKTISC